MYENLLIERRENKHYIVTPIEGYLICIPATEEEKELARLYEYEVEDYITSKIYLPLKYNLEENPMNIKAIEG